MKYSLSALLLLLSIVIGCSHDEPSSNNRIRAADQSSVPDSEVSGAKIYLYDGSRVTTEVVADKIVQFEAEDSTIAYHLNIDIIDSLGKVTTEVTGDSGVIHEGIGEFTIYGNVVVVTKDNTQLETDVLNWHSKTDRIYTDAFVRITSDDGVISGWGMESDQRLSWYKILHRVSGEMTNPEKITSPENK